jgi:uncharacterized protein (DUF4415 family)
MSKNNGVSEAPAEPSAADDMPELTRERAARLRPAREIFPEEILSQFKRSPGRPRAEAPKRQVTVRLDADLLDHLRAQGPGWQSRMNETLRKAAGL